jgi:hypothetical protein
MTTTNEHMITLLNKRFPGIDAVSDEEFHGEQSGFNNVGGIWFRNTEGYTINGMPILNVYDMEYDMDEVVWIMGIHKTLEAFLGDHGWFAEPYDNGTLMAYS